MKYRRISAVASAFAAAVAVMTAPPAHAAAATHPHKLATRSVTAPGLSKPAFASTPLPFTTYRDVVVDSTTGYVFVSGGAGTTAIAVFDLGGNPVRTIASEQGATGLQISPDGSTLYAALTDANAIAVINAKTLTETTRYATGTGTAPYWLAQESAGTVWFSYGTQWSGGLGSVTLSSGTVALHPSPQGPGYAAPLRITASTAAPGVLVSGETQEEPSTVEVYNVTSGTPTVTATSQAWGADPCTFVSDLAISADGKDVLVACGAALNAYKLTDYSADGSYGSNSANIAVNSAGQIASGDGTALQIFHTGNSTALRNYTTASAAGYSQIRGVAWGPDTTAVYGVTDTGSALSLTIWYGSNFVAYGPVRLLDTRFGTGAAQAKIGPGQSVKIQVAGNGTIPADVTAVALNITPIGASKYGVVTAYPDGTSVPSTSNLNWLAGVVRPNMSIVPVGTDGAVDLYNSGPGTLDLVADTTGYFVPDLTTGAGYTPLTPARILDTRDGTGQNGVRAPIPAGGTISVMVAGADGGQIPAGVAAVALNLTATEAAKFGFITAYPSGQSLPNASNVNYGGENVANMAIVPVGADGRIQFYNSTVGSVHLIADVTGYFSTTGTSLYHPLQVPARLFDSRSPSWGRGPLPPESYLSLHFQNLAITAFAFNTTVTDTTAAGFLTVFPNTSVNSIPNASNLNWGTGETVPNLALASGSGDGVVDFLNGSPAGSTDLVIDLFGYFSG